MKELYYVCVQPTKQYYAWQVEVMLENFIKNGIEERKIHILGAVDGETHESWDKLQKKYPQVRFFFYQDTRVSRVYISSLRPHVLAKHFTKHPELQKHAIFYHDCDMVFTKHVDWSAFIQDDIWYMSNTRSYISASYIQSKKYGIYERMCEIIGIGHDIPEENEKNSGGAQYILKNVDSNFWAKVEADCEELYKFFQQHLRAFPQTPTYLPIQMWTADMWAVLWNGWYFGHTTQVVPEMEFCWPMNDMRWWGEFTIYHNAGVVSTTDGLFHKGSYLTRLPYDINITQFKSDKCSYKYVEEILATGQNSCLLT